MDLCGAKGGIPRAKGVTAGLNALNYTSRFVYPEPKIGPTSGAILEVFCPQIILDTLTEIHKTCSRDCKRHCKGRPRMQLGGEGLRTNYARCRTFSSFKKRDK